MKRFGTFLFQIFSFFKQLTKAQIVESRFAGNHYWNKILVHNIPLIMYSENKLEGNIKVEIKD